VLGVNGTCRALRRRYEAKFKLEKVSQEVSSWVVRRNKLRKQMLIEGERSGSAVWWGSVLIRSLTSAESCT
jgi:hypothetical protein